MTNRSKEELNRLVDRYDISSEQRVIFATTAFLDVKEGIAENDTPSSVYDVGQPGDDRPDFDSLGDLSFYATVAGEPYCQSYATGSYIDNLNTFLDEITQQSTI